MPSKSQATQLPTFGAFKKYITRKQNRLPSSTENSYREEESDCRVFLKTCAEPASQLSHGIKYLIFQKITIFSSKFRSTATRLKFSHLGNLLKLRNIQKCMMGNHHLSLLLLETQSIQMIIRELPV